ncbi:hypothetical protein TWF694_001704 [Orbilia ellipsospora]|uniref:CENP-V/GFA domain-containing protein n=1 Tax=Orbilia ellipsospora TaxID=2528407 RepID=A0AAV9X4N4_9PEZI
MSDVGTETRKPISGGCLCKAVRYSIAFPEGTWPPKNNICHCTQCRKNTGALMSHFISVCPQQVSWTCEDRSFREFSSSQGKFRGFCQACGSTVSWRDVNVPLEIDLFCGTMDEEFLTGDTGRDILLAEKQLWCSNMVPGISDGVKSKFMYTANSGSSLINE